MIRRILIFSALLAALIAWQAPRYLRAASVLTSTVGIKDETGLTAWVTDDIGTEEVVLPLDPPMAAIVHRPREQASDQGILLIHGIHPDGMREPRFQRFARSMAKVGNVVMTPSLPELSGLEATPHSIKRVQQAAEALHQQLRKPIVAIGISVGGGLTLMAAANQSGASPIGQVVAVGAHHDLLRVARHYAGVAATDSDGIASDLKPHHYGIQVLARAHAEHLFTGADAATARAILQDYLKQHYQNARGRIPALSGDGQALMLALLDAPHGQVVQRHLLAAITEVEPALRQVSPAAHLAGLTVPVLLLHGETDPVIPKTELSRLAQEVPNGRLRDSLVTPVLTHTDFPEGAELRDFLRIMTFVADMLPPI